MPSGVDECLLKPSSRDQYGGRRSARQRDCGAEFFSSRGVIQGLIVSTMVRLFAGDGIGYERLGWASELAGMYDQAVTAWEQAASLMGDARSTALLGRSYALAGRRGDALRILDELLRQESTSCVPPLGIALLYDGLGDGEEAIRWIERGDDVHDAHMWWLNAWPAFDPLRSDARFQRLVRRMNFAE